VSTAYVNCDRKGGEIYETIYEDDQDVEQIVKKIMEMDLQYVKDNEKKLIGNFPNTYTFTKNLAEKYLKKHKDDVKCVVVRPSIIASSL
jgi:fatty acyl-CoA reductase